MTIVSTNPATLETLMETEENSIEDVENAFAKAKIVQREWRKL
jgi:acyl-CoA reductase-like NAD-dependent aldehyde dehydrogenase